MRRLTKFFLMGGLFLCLMGGLMSLSGWLLGADTHALDSRVETILGKSVSQWAGETSNWNKTVQSVELEAFDSIQVDLDLGDVTVYSGESYGVFLTYWGRNYQVLHEIKDGKLHIWSESDGHNLSNVGAEVEIYLPQDAQIKKGDLDLAMGDLTWQDVGVQGKLTCGLGMGDAFLQGELTGDVEVSSGMGEVEVVMAGLPKSDCRYELSTGMGDVYLNGEEQSGQSLKQGEGSTNIALSTGMGDVSLEFYD